MWCGWRENIYEEGKGRTWRKKFIVRGGMQVQRKNEAWDEYAEGKNDSKNTSEKEAGGRKENTRQQKRASVTGV